MTGVIALSIKQSLAFMMAGLISEMLFVLFFSYNRYKMSEYKA